MGPAAAVLACTLDLLGSSARALPPIEVVASAPPDVSPNANGFVRAETPVIHLITSAPPFEQARCDNPRSLVPLAGVIVHEAWHVQNGSDERGAYEAQLYTILRLGGSMDSKLYRGVYRSMQIVLEERKAPAGRPLLAQRAGTPEP